MGDYAQALVDIDVSDEAAPQLKQRLLRWLIEKRVVVEQVSDCVLGSKGGYAPGENYGYALWGHDGAYRAEPPRLWTNGLSIDIDRTVYWGGDLEWVQCPQCGFREMMTLREEGRWDTAFDEAITRWHGGGVGLVPCLGCGADIGLNDWKWSDPWAFGALGVKIWNWEPLGEDFIAQVRDVLDGHRVVYSAYKL